MISFPKKFHRDVREGKINLIFKPWDTLKVLRGKIYRSHNLGLLRVLDVDFKKFGDITLDEINRCGFEGMEEFREYLIEHAEGYVDFDNGRIVRIEFEYIGEDIENYKKAMGNVKDSEIFNIKEQLLLLEQKNKIPWIRKTLQLLKEKEYVLSKDLEQVMKIPVDRIKQHMRRLKALHLITSNSRKGYSITPLGVKLLKNLGTKGDDES